MIENKTTCVVLLFLIVATIIIGGIAVADFIITYFVQPNNWQSLFF